MKPISKEIQVTKLKYYYRKYIYSTIQIQWYYHLAFIVGTLTVILITCAPYCAPYCAHKSRVLRFVTSAQTSHMIDAARTYNTRLFHTVLANII